ncbi:sugar phosphate isomerase/epimerase family protein [Aureimonas leprariae]|uniref:TIM barrel protein n=1 Tax=Plantimonas leprariae TaxID=2615207 RepID=A0A7V7TXQ9_9HYPH|nr:TIM barrel protein [Aureimonas leprariae]KAB0681355.1 TIM barrel protein [Aureimonas leprariae]
MSTLLPGLCSVTFRRLAPESVLQLAAEAGIAAIEWGGDVHVPPGDRETAARVGRLTREAGLRVSSYGSYLAPPDASPDAVRDVFEVAEALGCRHVRIWPGRRDRPSADYAPEERRAAIDAIRQVGDEAAARGLTIGLEYHPNSLTDELASARDLMAEIDAPNVFLYWQPSPGIGMEAALAEIAAIGGAVCHLHVFAWDAARNRYPLATQGDEWRRYFAALPERRWQEPCFAMLEFVENDDPASFERDAETLRALLAAG